MSGVATGPALKRRKRSVRGDIYTAEKVKTTVLPLSLSLPPPVRGRLCKEEMEKGAARALSFFCFFSRYSSLSLSLTLSLSLSPSCTRSLPLWRTLSFSLSHTHTGVEAHADAGEEGERSESSVQDEGEALPTKKTQRFTDVPGTNLWTRRY